MQCCRHWLRHVAAISSTMAAEMVLQAILAVFAIAAIPGIVLAVSVAYALFPSLPAWLRIRGVFHTKYVLCGCQW